MKTIADIHKEIKACKSCPKMCGEPVHGREIKTNIMLIGQAPGEYEGPRGKPWAHTAGKTLFNWFHAAAGWSEEDVRDRIYIGATVRCFPGKNKAQTGDRIPDKEELTSCRRFIKAEMDILRPTLMIAVGKLAIEEILGKKVKLDDVVGEKLHVQFCGHNVTVIPMPHPSGRSTWIHTQNGKKSLARALKLLGKELNAESFAVN